MQGSVHRQRRVEADRQMYSLFRESSSVAFQTSTDLKSLKVVMVRRLAAQEHSAAHVQLASCISAIMKFGAGADGDPFVRVKVQITSALQKQTSCLYLTMRLDRIGSGSFEQLIGDSKTFYHDAVNSVWQHKRISLDKNTFQIELQ